MKSSFIICLAAGAVVAMTTACTNLDVDVESQYTHYPDTDIAQEAELADVCYHLRTTWGCHYMEAQALSSDEWVGLSFSGDYYDSGTFAHPTLHNFNCTDQSLNWFNDVSAGITKANLAITDLTQKKARADRIASARAMRAFFHWVLMDSFGDVPILEGVPSDTVEVVRCKRADVARFIERELLDVIPQLPAANDASTYGKPTRWMAEALLVKLYLNWAVYTASDVTQYDASTAVNEKLDSVVKYCDDILGSHLFSLSEGARGYRSKFWPDNGPQIKDFIYAISYETTSATGMLYGRPRTWRQGRNDGAGGPGYYGTQLSMSTGGNFSMTPECASRFSLVGDDRNDNVLGDTVYMFDPSTYARTAIPYLYKGKPVVLSKDIELDAKVSERERLDCGKTVHGWSQGYKSVKWFVIDADYKNARNQSNDVPVFRLADIILEKAEAIRRGAAATNGDTPQSLLNQIRRYVHAPELEHEPSLAEILDERGRELFDENWRRNDMIRFGTFENEYGFHRRNFPTARFDKECRVFPIPKSTLDQNINWKQNAGY